MTGVFVSGRQHSGNTVVCEVLGRHPDVFVDRGENLWFERRAEVEAARTPEERARRTVRWLLRKRHAEAAAVEGALAEWHRARPDAPATDVFARAMELVTAAAGKRMWALKGTSYVFHAEAILDALPEARLVYMLRNPLDLAASTVRRDRAKSASGGQRIRSDWVWTLAIGWARGLRRARSLAARLPDRARIVRYEDLVTDPAVLADLCAWLGLAYDPAMAEVRHVNRSERGSEDDGPRGLNATRVGYWTSVLTPARAWAVRSLVDPELLREEYPALAALAPEPFGARARGRLHQAVCAARLARRQAGALAAEPAHAARRLVHRVRGRAPAPARG